MERLVRSQDRRRIGAASSNRGAAYQRIFVLRMLSRLMGGVYDGFRHEDDEDYVAWRDPERPDTDPTYIFIQVKTKGKGCFLRSAVKVDEVLENFLHLVESDPRAAPARCEFVLVYNRAHDCRAAGCEAAIRKRPMYLRLRTALAQGGAGPKGRIRFEPFLSLIPTAQDVRTELAFLGPATGALLDHLAARNALAGLAASLAAVAVTVEGSLGIEPGGPAAVDFRREDAKARLTAAVTESVRRVCGEAEDAVSAAQRRAVQETAADEVRASLDRTALRPAREGGLQVRFPDAAAAATALETIHALRSLERPSGWGSARSLSRQGGGFILTQATPPYPTLQDYLRTTARTHLQRVALIRSLITTLGSWSKAGVYLSAWRGEQPAFRTLYRVDTSAEPSVVIADLGALRTFDPSRDGLVSSEFARGQPLSRAVLQIYYGSADWTRIRRSSFYRAPWNDNIVCDLAHWLLTSLLRMDSAVEAVEFIFASDLGPPPIILQQADDQFLKDCLNNDFFSTVDGVLAVQPRTMSLDWKRGGASVYQLTGEMAQLAVGVSEAGQTAARRLTLYQRRRWLGNRPRDAAAAVNLNASQQVTPVVLVARPDLANTVALNVFGIQQTQVIDVFSGVFQSAERRTNEDVLPAILQPEHADLIDERGRLNVLSDPGFDYRMERDLTLGATTIRMADGRGVREHLAKTGYAKNAKSLFVTCEGDDFDAETLSLSDIQFDSLGARLVLSARGGGADIHEEGTLSFLDIGALKVVGNDLAAINELLGASRSAGDEEPASLTAWKALEALVGTSPLEPRRYPGLWQAQSSRDRGVKSPEPTLAPQPSDLVEQPYPADNEVWVVNGAPGTGKTRLVAAAAARVIAARSVERGYPPVRVLVVAASHYALDNFARVFADWPDAGVAYRDVPEGADPWTTDRDVDSQIFHRSQDHYRPIVEALLAIAAPEVRAGQVRDPAAKLSRAWRDLIAPLTEPDTPAIIPSHEQWRRNWLGRASPMPADQRRRMASLIGRRLEGLSGERLPGASRTRRPTELINHFRTYAAFSAPIIITTVDAFYDLPDLNYDMVIFEEASQLNLVKMLKVLTKVTRPRRDLGMPGMIFSGDPRQLTPFIRHASDEAGEAAARRATEARRREAPLEAMILRRPDRVIQLHNQHRMRPVIAELVRSLFYGDQVWRYSRPPGGQGLRWLDTGHLGGRAQVEPGSRSRYNTEEVRAVIDLVRSLGLPPKDVLVLSPYSAQVRRLGQELQGLARVKTIDGCQGQEARTVIISFVSLKFSPPRNDFVADPHRMNVALSRATDNLHLVGDLQALAHSVARHGHHYPHMAGLLHWFASGRDAAVGVTPAQVR